MIFNLNINFKGLAIAFPNKDKASDDPKAPNYCRSNCITSLYVQAIITLVIAAVCALIVIVMLILGCFKKKALDENGTKDRIKEPIQEDKLDKI